MLLLLSILYYLKYHNCATTCSNHTFWQLCWQIFRDGENNILLQVTCYGRKYLGQHVKYEAQKQSHPRCGLVSNTQRYAVCLTVEIKHGFCPKDVIIKFINELPDKNFFLKKSKSRAYEISASLWKLLCTCINIYV